MEAVKGQGFHGGGFHAAPLLVLTSGFNGEDSDASKR